MSGCIPMLPWASLGLSTEEQQVPVAGKTHGASSCCHQRSDSNKCIILTRSHWGLRQHSSLSPLRFKAPPSGRAGGQPMSCRSQFPGTTALMPSWHPCPGMKVDSPPKPWEASVSQGDWSPSEPSMPRWDATTHRDPWPAAEPTPTVTPASGEVAHQIPVPPASREMIRS